MQWVKATFITLQDMSGKIQLYVARDNLPEGVYAEDVGNWDLGRYHWGERYTFQNQNQ